MNLSVDNKKLIMDYLDKLSCIVVEMRRWKRRFFYCEVASKIL